MEHLLSSWPEIVTRMKNARTFLLFADYDGTLTPIVDRPEDAVISDNVKEVLRSLSVLPNFTVGVISGRSLTDIINKVGLISLVYAGNHGMEIKELSGITTIDSAVRISQPIIHSLYRVLVKNLSQIKGAQVEYKGLSLSIHYRLIDEGMLHDVTKIFEDATDIAQKAGDIRITHGKKVFEVRPAIDISKGDAIRMLINKYKKGNLIDSKTLLPIYVGDDQTDEDGFNAVEEHGNGISIFVGDPQTESAARYYLESPDEVTKFLRMLHDQVESAFVREGIL